MYPFFGKIDRSGHDRRAVVGQRLVAVDRLQASGPRVGDHLLPQAFGFAADDDVAVLERLLGHRGRVDAAHDDLHAALPVGRGQLVRAAQRVLVDTVIAARSAV